MTLATRVQKIEKALGRNMAGRVKMIRETLENASLSELEELIAWIQAAEKAEKEGAEFDQPRPCSQLARVFDTMTHEELDAAIGMMDNSPG